MAGLFSASGNSSAFFGVFFDSFAKIAISTSVLKGMVGLNSLIIYTQIMPGLCFALFLLNLCYFIQARRMAFQLNSQVTAIPSGLQASCVFVWLFAIMLPIAITTKNPILAYHVALLANLINAIIFTLSGILLTRFKQLIPQPALMSGLAASAFTWLAVNNIGIVFNHPISGVIPLFLLLILLIGKFNSKVSPVLLGIGLGSILALINHEILPSVSLTQALHIQLPQIYITGLLTHKVIHYMWNYLPLIIAFALIDAISAVQIMEETVISGDKFNPYYSILISGFISGGSALMGNPFAMALFFGHAAWKKLKATYNYALWVGLAFLFIGSLGLITLIINYIPAWVSLPILIFIGISTTSLCFANLEARYYPILVMAIIPILIEMMYNKLELLALQGHITHLNQLLGGTGLLVLAKGSIFFGIGFAGFMIYIMEQKWLNAMITSLILLLLSIIGFIHAITPGIYLFNKMNIVYVSLALFCGCLYLKDKYAKRTLGQ